MDFPHSSKRIIRKPEVLHLTGLKKSNFAERVKAGTFPAPVPLGGGKVGWRLYQVEEWIDQLGSERKAA